MGGKIGVIFLLVVLAGVALYVYNSGALQKGLQSVQSLAPRPATTTPSGGTTTAATPGVPPPPAPGVASGGAASPSPGTAPVPTPSSSIRSYDVPPGFAPNQLSPYFRQVRFAGVSPSYGYGSYGTITLYASLQNPSSTLDITGWQIKAVRGSLFVPQAVNLYDPSGLAPAGDIRLGQGDYVNMYSSSGPFNLRLNKCIGYIAAQNPQLNPPLPQTCPYIDRSEIQYLSGACQNFIGSVGACSQPNLSSPYYPRNDYACDQFVQSHFSYYSCFNERSSDPDFLSHEIRVWTGSSPLDQYHDRVQLLDANGLLVDYYSY